MLASFLCGEYLLLIQCWLHFYLGSFSYTSRAGFIFMWGDSLTPPVLTLVLCGEFVLRIPCCIDFYARSFSYISRARFFIYFINFFYLGSFFYTSRAGFFLFSGGGSLTYPMLDSFLSGESLLHIPCSLHFYLWSFSYTSHAVFTLLCGVSLTYPKLFFFLFF